MTGGLVVLSLWMGVLGYGVLYAGVQKLGGDKTCTLANAFRGQCGKGGGGGGGVGGPRPLTLQQQRARTFQQQWAHLAAQPLIHAGYRG